MLRVLGRVEKEERMKHCHDFGNIIGRRRKPAEESPAGIVAFIVQNGTESGGLVPCRGTAVSGNDEVPAMQTKSRRQCRPGIQSPVGRRMVLQAYPAAGVVCLVHKRL